VRGRIFDGALNSTILIDFFKRLIKGQKKKVFLILDNLRTLNRPWATCRLQALSVQCNAPRWIKAPTRFGFISVAD
jgi:hypothetical protein